MEIITRAFKEPIAEQVKTRYRGPACLKGIIFQTIHATNDTWAVVVIAHFIGQVVCARSDQEVGDDALGGFLGCDGKRSALISRRKRRADGLTGCLHQPTLRHMELHCLGGTGPEIVVVEIIIVAVPQGLLAGGLLRGSQNAHAWLRSGPGTVTAGPPLTRGARRGTLERRRKYLGVQLRRLGLWAGKGRIVKRIARFLSRFGRDGELGASAGTPGPGVAVSFAKRRGLHSISPVEHLVHDGVCGLLVPGIP